MTRFALAYREQRQLFLLDKTYLAGTAFKLGGMATLLAQSVVQFFYRPGLAVAITVGTLLVMSLLLWLSVRRDRMDWTPAPLCIVPALFWAGSLSDHAMHFDAIVAVLFALAALCAYVRIRRARLLWGTLLTIACYFLAGPSATLFAICALILDIARNGKAGWKSLLYPAVGVLCAAIAVWAAALPTWERALTPAFHYDFDSAMPACHWWTWLSVPAVVLLAVWAQYRSERAGNGRKWTVFGLGILIALLSLMIAVICGSRLEKKEPLATYEYEYFVAAEDWNGLIQACKRNEWTPGTANYLNLALAKEGRLPDNLLKYDQRGVESLIYLTKDKSMDVHIAHIMDAMGNAAGAQDVAFNLLYSPQGFCPQMLKLNARIELMRGSYDVADKYLSLLEKAPHYHDWARSQRRFLWDDEAILAYPELGPGRLALPDEDGFAMFDDPLTELKRVIEANPDHPGAMQYMLGFLLLSKDIESLTHFVDRYYGAETLRALSVPVQEALIFYSDYSRNFDGVEPVSLDWCLSHGVTEETVRRFAAFQLESLRTGGAPPQGFQGTYWYYLLYKQI